MNRVGLGASSDISLLDSVLLFLSDGIPLMRKDPASLGSFNDVQDDLVKLIVGGFDDKLKEAITESAQALGAAFDAGLSDNKIRAKVLEVMDGIYGPLPAELAPEVLDAVVAVNGIGKLERLGALELAPHFNLKDVDSVRRIRDDGFFWIGDNYKKTVRDKINVSVGDLLAQGLGRDEVASGLVEALRGTAPLTRARSAVVASSAMTTGRSFSHVSSFEQAQVDTAEYFNPDDERTTDLCHHLNGKVFRTSKLGGIRDRYLKAKTPEDVKGIMKWPSLDYVKGLGSDTDVLAENGVGLPPLHGLCRSSVIFSSETKGIRKAEAIDGNQGAPYYSLEVMGAVVIYDTFKSENRSPKLQALSEKIFEDFIFDERLAEKAERAMKEGTPLLPVVVQKAGSSHIIMKYPHLVAASKSYGFPSIPCIVVSEGT